MPSIKVRSTGVLLVPDYKQLFAGRKAFVGWRFDPTHGTPVEIMEEDGRKVKVSPSAWIRHDEDVDLDVSDIEIQHEYRRHLALGELLAADQATCDFANRDGFAVAHGYAPVELDAPASTDSSDGN